MEAKLIRYTPDPERVIALAARLCYSSRELPELDEELTPERIRQLIRFLFDQGHLSPFEHASFTFFCQASRWCLNQLVRHRIASYSQRSMRYVEEEDFGFETPPSIAGNLEAFAVFRRQMTSAGAAYRDLLDLGIPKEDARYVLTGATSSKIIVTMNARQLLSSFFHLRCCGRAQWEIRRLAYLMLKEVRKVAPVVFENAGPSCESEGFCREGKLSCGRIKYLKPRPRKLQLRREPEDREVP